jgi:hypothetical protein
MYSNGWRIIWNLTVLERVNSSSGMESRFNPNEEIDRMML